MEKATQTVNGLRPTFKTQSDRLYSSGVSKKHNSYARYLARKKGKTICCCACTQSCNSNSGHRGVRLARYHTNWGKHYWTR